MEFDTAVLCAEAILTLTFRKKCCDWEYRPGMQRLKSNRLAGVYLDRTRFQMFSAQDVGPARVVCFADLSLAPYEAVAERPAFPGAPAMQPSELLMLIRTGPR